MSKKQAYIIVAGGCLLALCGVITLAFGFMFVFPRFVVATAPVPDLITITEEPPPNVDGLSTGDSNAPVIIDIFGDFQCPACQYFSDNIEPRIIEHLVNPGKARLVYHNYPFLDGDGAFNGGESDQAANASMCASEQGKFWEMKEIIFANLSGENQGDLSNRRLRDMAESINLNMDAFNACFRDNKYGAEIQADFEYGQELGVTGTPSVFVNGQQVGQPGKIATYQEIAAEVDAIVNSTP